MEFKTLENTSTQEILNVLNHAFSDYVIPYKLTLQQLQDKFSSENTDLSLSVGAFKKEKLVGFILHGLNANKTKVYNGGTGVIPNCRGKGLTVRMYQYSLPILKANNIASAILEVISSNQPAIKSYEKVGFKKVRILNCYDGEVELDKNQISTVIENTDQLKWLKFKTFWDKEPSWQYTAEAVSKLKNLTTYIAKKENEIMGYLIYQPARNKIVQLAVSQNHRRAGIATSLLNSIEIQKGHNLKMINVDDSCNSLNPFLMKNNFNIFIQQYEMTKKIS